MSLADDFATISLNSPNSPNNAAAAAAAAAANHVVTQTYSPKRPTRSMPNTVPPQPVSDRTLLDSVTGFLQDVTQSAGAGNTHHDASEAILWTRFETFADPCDPTIGDDWDVEGGVAPPLLLVLGYGSGVQCWCIPANGEAVEVLSWRHGSVRTLRLLPQPLPSGDGGGAPGGVSTGADGAAAAGSWASSPMTPPPNGSAGAGGGGGAELGGEAPAASDRFAAQRPLLAICDASAASAAPFCAVNFVSLRSAETVRSIKFKTPVLDIVANRSAVVISFADRLAVFDACTLEDRMTVTTCHPGVSISPNPVALGTRWMAYAERKLMVSKRSCGGCDGVNTVSYTATVLNAAKTLGKGLRELGEQMAAGFGAASSSSAASSAAASLSNGNGYGSQAGGLDDAQPGLVTIMDIKHAIRDTSPTTGAPVTVAGTDPIIAHFVAHSDALVALSFDYSGMLLATADRRGHDFHVFRVQPHPGGPSLASVHHLYVLHRGDTSAKVQDITFSLDSRWLAVSTLRGTTHVFPVTPYGGAAGVRTHGSPHVVNRLSRFHRSAGLSMDGVRSASPVHVGHHPHQHGAGGSAGGSGGGGSGGGGDHLLMHGLGGLGGNQQAANAYINPRLPPFPHPTVVTALAQLRQPSQLAAGGGNGGGGSGGGASGGPGGSQTATSGGGGIGGGAVSAARQRLTSLSEEVKPLRVCTAFARPRAWLLDAPGMTRDMTAARMQKRRAMDSLFVMAAHGALVQYDLEPKTSASVPKDRVCDDTAIELTVEPRAQWLLQRRDGSVAIEAPLLAESWLLRDRLGLDASEAAKLSKQNSNDSNSDGGGGGSASGNGGVANAPTATSIAAAEKAANDQWLSQVEIITHAGPHRRLWMGPQFMFKTYNAPSSGPLSLSDLEAIEVGLGGASLANANRPARSNPVNMPLRSNPQSIHDTAASGSFEHSPRLRNFDHMGSDLSINTGDSQLREDLADAMRESPGRQCAASRDCTDYGAHATITAEEERHSSTSSLSSTSRASFDAPISGSPTPSFNGDGHVLSYHENPSSTYR